MLRLIPLMMPRLAPESDEIDVELVGGDPRHWQTNVFAPAPHEDQPLYGAFSSIQTYPHATSTVRSTHTYTIDWSPERIVWIVDGSKVRTLNKGTRILPLIAWEPSHEYVQRIRKSTVFCTTPLMRLVCSLASGMRVPRLGRPNGLVDLSIGTRSLPG